MFNEGMYIAIFGAALAATLAGLGSAIGVQMGGKAAAGVLSEKPELFGKMIVLQALPGTQGMYGFLTAIIVLGRLGLTTNNPALISTDQGWAFFGACLPIAIVGLVSAIFQAKMSVNAIHMTAKQPSSSGRGIMMTVLVETYAILALLASILMVNGIQV